MNKVNVTLNEEFILQYVSSHLKCKGNQTKQLSMPLPIAPLDLDLLTLNSVENSLDAAQQETWN